MKKEGLYITQMECTSFMGIKHQVIDFGNGNVFLIGGNGAGKSSLINALLSPLNSKYTPLKPIHDGEERGVITLKIEGTRNGEFEQYEIQSVFTPSNRNGKLSVTRNGEKIKGAERTIINQIFGKIGFDLAEFFSATEKEQIKMLEDVSGCGEKLQQIDHQRQGKEVERKIIKKELDDAKTVNSRSNRPFTDEDIDKYKELIPEEEVRKMEEELKGVEEKVQKYNENLNKVNAVVAAADQAKKDIQSSDKVLMEVVAEIEKLKEKKDRIERERENAISTLKMNEEKMVRCNEWKEKNPSPPSSAVIVQKLADVREHNRMVGIISEYATRQKDIIKKQQRYEGLDEEVKGLHDLKKKTIASSQLPIEGLLWGEDGITLDGIPISQVNTQKQLDLAISIAVAMNPTLKLVIINEASLFDNEHLKATLQRLTDLGYYFVCEMVDPNGGELEIKYEERSSE